MTDFATFSPLAGGSAGFSVVAGRAPRLLRVLLAGGRLPAGWTSDEQMAAVLRAVDPEA